MNWRFDTRTIGDGNCFYGALEQQLRRPELAQLLDPAHCQLSHIQLREKICEFMMSSLPPDDQPDNWPSTGMGQFLKASEVLDLKTDPMYANYTMKKFLTEQKYNKTWANQIMIQGAACYLGLEIWVASNTNRSSDPVSYFKTGPGMDEETTQTLCLGMYELIHFQSFIPSQNEE